MSRVATAAVVLLLLAGHITTEENKTIDHVEESCALHDDAGPWSVLLQEWALGATEHSSRHGRIMALPPAQGYYVSDRVDGPMLSPPPLPQQHMSAPHHHAKHPNKPNYPASGPGSVPGGRPFDEWQHSPPLPPNTGKIVNRPPNPYKDKFKPSYPAPGQPIPVHHNTGAHLVDRVDENRQPPQKQVSETDLYLLGAIEKLVYRADLMEKRLRKMEETVHYLVAGVDTKPEPCATNFTRVGEGCYHMSSDALNWKGANYACRRLKANMLEVDSDHERNKLTSALLNDKRLRGGDFWTGGLNPGLLWIWSHSARPVVSNSTAEAGNSTVTHITGDGRCLAWLHDAATTRYVFRGHDCALRHRYICEKEEDDTKLSNEIARVARKMADGRKPKILWSDSDDEK